MRKSRLDSLAVCGVAFDTETHLVQPGLVAPPLVVGSAARLVSGSPRGKLLDKASTRDAFVRMLENPDVVIVGANVAYDMLVMAVDAARRGVDLMPAIFNAYENERVFDIQIAEQLHAIACGALGKDPRTGRPLTDPITGEPAGYSLAVCTDLVLGRKNAKANDRFRQSYALLENTPIDQWPTEARVYPIDDAINTLEVALAQAGHVVRPGPHVFPSGGPGSEPVCQVCGLSVYENNKPCQPRKWRSRNLHDLANQCYTHFAMHLGAAWGFTVDHAATDALADRVGKSRNENAEPFLANGFLRWKKEKGKLKLSRHMAVIKKQIAVSYGCKGACSFCNGTGKVPSPKAVRRTCGRKCTGNGCALCGGTGERWDKLVNCKPCDATGLVLESASVPRSDGSKCKPCKTAGTLPSGDECEECSGSGIVQGIATTRDTLYGSGNEALTNFGAWMQDAKILETYIPWLRNTDDDGIEHRNVPLTLKPNVLLETGRTSYRGVVQQLPRVGGIRECIVARPGRVFVSVDYEAGELVTHGQSAKWITGYSALAEALNKGIKVHNAFAATVLGQAYEFFQEQYKLGDKRSKDVRQAAKPGNFGFPGRMGAATLVITQRKQGPDTPCKNGSTWIIDEDAGDDEHGNPIKTRGYKGLRFCILMDGADRCGELPDGTPNMIDEWKGRKYTPMCKRCVECAERLRSEWLKQWPENVNYFAFVKHCEDNGQPITDEQRALFNEYEYEFSGGVWHLAPGEIVQHVSNRIRGGKMNAESIGNAIANGWFQGLLADAAKSALRRVARECYDITYRMPIGAPSPLFGARVILFAHDELIAELWEHNAHEAAHRISEVMVEELRRYCPDLAKACAAEPALMRKWYKGASPVYVTPDGKPCKSTDPGARLIPWEPKKKKV